MVLSLAGACGRSTSAAPDADPDDLDGDGIANALDDCPLRYDAVQHDEDGDGVGDVCDNCPTVPNPDQRDTTEEASLQFADGVGDACDLRPARAGDQIAAFLPFASETEARAWTSTGWTITGDALHATGAAHLESTHGEIGDGVIAQVRMTVGWLDPDAEVLAAIDGDGAGLGVGCALDRDRDGDGADELRGFEVGGQEVVTSLDAAIAPGDPIVLTTWRTIATSGTTRTGRILCRVEIAGISHALEAPSDPNLWIGSYAFTSTGAQVDASSWILYTSPQARGN